MFMVLSNKPRSHCYRPLSRCLKITARGTPSRPKTGRPRKPANHGTNKGTRLVSFVIGGSRSLKKNNVTKSKSKNSLKRMRLGLSSRSRDNWVARGIDVLCYGCRYIAAAVTAPTADAAQSSCRNCSSCIDRCSCSSLWQDGGVSWQRRSGE